MTQLANLAGIHKAVISKIENGDTKRPEWKTIKAIASILDIPYEQRNAIWTWSSGRTHCLS
ncbi:helix-turn-helix domain-containing protein [Brevibacillus sp. WF146]|uniref:helix-turn-helix domain-containing protein n=1 Tax=Brevibacillus sp. WF146 TaxID=319501 RepID=UPI0009FD6C53